MTARLASAMSFHLDDPGKAQYNASARVRSPKFYFKAYEKKDELREKARADKKKACQGDLAAFMGAIMDIVREKQNEFLDSAASAQYCAALNGFSPTWGCSGSRARIKAYCDSVRGMHL